MSGLGDLAQSFLIWSVSLREERDLIQDDGPEERIAFHVLGGMANAAQTTCEKLRMMARTEAARGWRACPKCGPADRVEDAPGVFRCVGCGNLL